MSTRSDTAIIVFDGACVLCNGWVRVLLRHDRKRRYRFAAMQSRSGSDLLSRHGLDPLDPSSFLLIDERGASTDTEAIARVLAGLGGRWRWAAAVLTGVPRVLRDPAYRVIARNRYRWFGRRAQCLVPEPSERARFLD